MSKCEGSPVSGPKRGEGGKYTFLNWNGMHGTRRNVISPEEKKIETKKFTCAFLSILCLPCAVLARHNTPNPVDDR